MQKYAFYFYTCMYAINSRFMNTKEYEEILYKVSNISTLIAKIKQLKKQLNSVNRKIDTIYKNHSFLLKIIGENVNDHDLEYQLKLFFKSVGYKKVDLLKKRTQKEDLRIWNNNTIILTETTGFKNETIKSSHLVKIKTCIDFADKYTIMKGYTIRGLVIVNHDFNKHYTKRKENPFANEMDLHSANKNNITAITTVDLLKGFIKLKIGDINFDTFNNTITKNGIVKF